MNIMRNISYINLILWREDVINEKCNFIRKNIYASPIIVSLFVQIKNLLVPVNGIQSFTLIIRMHIIASQE